MSILAGFHTLSGLWLLAFLSTALPGSAAEAPRRASWDDLPNLLGGQEFETVLTNGVSIRARALAFSENAAEVKVGRTSDKTLIPVGRQQIPRELFSSVTVRRRKGPARALLATVCTLGGMLATTAVIGRGGYSESEPSAGDVAVILSVGAGAGIFGYYWGARIDDRPFTVTIQPADVPPKPTTTTLPR